MPKTDKYRIVICTPAIYSAGGFEMVVSVKANYYDERFRDYVNICIT